MSTKAKILRNFQIQILRSNGYGYTRIEQQAAAERQAKRQARLEIVSELYKRGMSVRKIAKEVQARLQLDRTPSTQTIFADIQLLLAEWREYRITNTDELVQLELERIDDAIVELWDAWNKSKEDYEQTQAKQKGAPTVGKDGKKKNNIYQTEQQKRRYANTVMLATSPRYANSYRRDASCWDCMQPRKRSLQELMVRL